MSTTRRHAKQKASLRERHRRALEELELLRVELARLRGSDGQGRDETAAAPGDETAAAPGDATAAAPGDATAAARGCDAAARAGAEAAGGESVSRAEYRALEGKFQRLAADFENTRKRSSRETERLVREQGEKFLLALLPVVDNMERGLQHMQGDGGDVDSLRKGVESTYAQFCAFLDSVGLQVVEALGKPFDPKIHDAIFQHPTNEIEADHVAFEVEKGYMWGDKLLRPTRVGVAVPAPEADGKASGDEGAGDGEASEAES